MNEGTLDDIIENITPICMIEQSELKTGKDIVKECGQVILAGYPNNILGGISVGGYVKTGNQVYSITGKLDKISLIDKGYGIAIHSLDSTPG